MRNDLQGIPKAVGRRVEGPGQEVGPEQVDRRRQPKIEMRSVCSSIGIRQKDGRSCGEPSVERT